MASKSTVVNFPESTARNRTQSITIPNLKRVVSVTANTGTAGYSVNGNEVTVDVSGGTHTRYTTSNYTPSKSVSDSRTSSTDSFPGSISYNDGTYSGTLSKSGGSTASVVSGSPAASKTASSSRSSSGSGSDGCSSAQSSAAQGLSSPVPYSDTEGYSGTLPRTGISYGECKRSGQGSDNWEWSVTAFATYSGTVSKPDTRKYNYTQGYSGTVYGPTQTSYTYYYAYTVTVTYEDNYGQTLTLTAPVSGLKLSEGKTMTVLGTTLETDAGDIVSVYIRINKGVNYRIHQSSADGTNPISFSRTLTFTGGAIKDGTSYVSTHLDEGITHLLEVWSEDNKGGTSIIAERTFTVSLNRPPTLTNSFPPISDSLAEDTPVAITGTVSDPEGNVVTMNYRLNGGAAVSIPITAGAWSVTLTPKQLLEGSNNLVVTATDSLGASTTLTFTLTRAITKTPLKVAHARYKLTPQVATAKEVLAWLTREIGDLTIDGALSIVEANAAESYQAMTKTTSPVTTGIVEDQFIGTYGTANAKLHLKLTLTASDANSTASAVSLAGAIKA